MHSENGVLNGLVTALQDRCDGVKGVGTFVGPREISCSMQFLVSRPANPVEYGPSHALKETTIAFAEKYLTVRKKKLPNVLTIWQISPQ